MGDRPGHPFRGNQWSSGGGSGRNRKSGTSGRFLSGGYGSALAKAASSGKIRQSVRPPSKTAQRKSLLDALTRDVMAGRIHQRTNYKTSPGRYGGGRSPVRGQGRRSR